jgi:hypothetical protein
MQANLQLLSLYETLKARAVGGGLAATSFSVHHLNAGNLQLLSLYEIIKNITVQLLKNPWIAKHRGGIQF